MILRSFALLFVLAGGNYPASAAPESRNLQVQPQSEQHGTDSDSQEDKRNQEADADTLATVTVIGRRANLVGEAISASEGSVGQTAISQRPLLRTGGLLEFVPGLVATQHSGNGKANQYFLRGFNLDHGTDFAVSVAGMPVNMRSHGHGQGYTDLNFLIPETVRELHYRKGTYYADVGDFSSAGAAEFRLFDTVAQGEAKLAAGSYGFARSVVVDSVAAGNGNLLYATEAQTYDGPWTDIEEDVSKFNAMLRYSQAIGSGRGRVTLMAYRNDWNSADQIPERAVEQGLIDVYGQLDVTDGGETSRTSLSAGWDGSAFGGQLSANAYAIDYEMKLWSNFTYFLDDPVNGDQFLQVDDRRIFGFDVSQQWETEAGRFRTGVQTRYDDIARVALLHTEARRVIGTIRDDVVEEGSIGVYVAHEYHFSDKLRSYVGARYDYFDFAVDALLPANSGEETAGESSVKASLIYQPIKPLELYASYGTGFHSNDARGTTIQVDPVTGGSAQPVDPLVGSVGAELGSRFYFSDRLQATVALWTLRLDSELLFVGDAGNTEASRPSRRDGIEAGLYWFGSEFLTADLEVSYSRSRFRDEDSAGDEIPGSIPLVISADVVATPGNGWLASARLRHFGPYPLIEDGSVESDGSTILNLRFGREWDRFGVFIDVLNALDSRDHDIDYYYASRLPGEQSAGVEDIHFHVFAPRSVRASLHYKFGSGW